MGRRVDGLRGIVAKAAKIRQAPQHASLADRIELRVVLACVANDARI